MSDDDDTLEILETPATGRPLIVGWRQWADAGSVSSALPEYLVEQGVARPIGGIAPDGFYLFQMPTSHHLMRPVVTLKDGHVEELEGHDNTFFYVGEDDAGFYVFLGDEPHLDEERYLATMLDAAEQLEVSRIIVLGGVYGEVPYDRDRQISCTYSLPSLKSELERYAVSFSNYQGGTTIGTMLVARAEERDIEAVGFYAIVPSYDFSQTGISVQAIAISDDHKAWYDVMLRLEHMLALGIDLSDLIRRARDLVSDWDARLAQLSENMPQLGVAEHMAQVRSEFEERSFVPLGDVWIEGLKDLFDDSPEE